MRTDPAEPSPSITNRLRTRAAVGVNRFSGLPPLGRLAMLGMLVEARTDQSRAMGLSAMLACRAAYGEGLVEDLGSGAVTASLMAGLDRFGSFGDEVMLLLDTYPDCNWALLAARRASWPTPRNAAWHRCSATAAPPR